MSKKSCTHRLPTRIPVAYPSSVVKVPKDRADYVSVTGCKDTAKF